MRQLQQQKIADNLNENNIKWYINLPSSPWMGGVMESLVKITKKCLKEALKDHIVSEETLHTYLEETESNVDSRPLTPVANNPNDIESLAPNHFLVSQASLNQRINATTEKETNLCAKWKTTQAMPDIFWKNGLRNTFQV